MTPIYYYGASKAERHLEITKPVVCLSVCLSVHLPVCPDFHIWHVCSRWQDLSDGNIYFEHVTLTVTFDLYLENFNSAH